MQSYSTLQSYSTCQVEDTPGFGFFMSKVEAPSFLKEVNPLMSSPDYDVGVIGGGISGLAAAAELSGEGLSVKVFERKDTLSDPRPMTVERRLFEEGSETLRLNEEAILLPLTGVIFLGAETNRSRVVKLVDKNNESIILQVDHDRIRKGIIKEGGVEVNFGVEVDSLTEDRELIVVKAQGETIKTRYIVDASGLNSKLALPENRTRLVDIVYGTRCHAEPIDQRLSQGYLLQFVGDEVGRTTWIAPENQEEGIFHVVASTYARLGELQIAKIRERYEHLKRVLRERLILNVIEELDVFSGCFSLQPAQFEGGKRAIMAGERSGVGSPLVGDNVRPALVQARLIARGVKEGKSARQIYVGWKKNHALFPYTLEYALSCTRAGKVWQVGNHFGMSGVLENGEVPLAIRNHRWFASIGFLRALRSPEGRSAILPVLQNYALIKFLGKRPPVYYP